MNRYLLSFLCASALALPARAADDAIAVEKVLDAVRVGTNSTAYGKTISVDNQRLAGNFGLQLSVSGTTAALHRVDMQVSNDGQFFAIPDGWSAIDTTVASGTNFYAVTVPLARYIRLRVMTTNDGANVSAWLSYQ